MITEYSNNSEWSFVKLGLVCKLQNGYAFESSSFKDEGIPIIRISNIENGAININDKIVFTNDTSISKEFSVINGDVLIAMSGATTGKSGKYNSDKIAYVNQRVGKFVLKGNYLHKDYLFYVVQSPIYLLPLFKNLSVGAQPNIGSKQIEEVTIPLPPLPEQQKIAEILSTVDAKIEVIDNQITETQALKKGLMQRLLTKGIGHAEFKDSALGEIPKSWEVVKFGDIIYSHCYGPRFSSKDYSETGNVKTIRGTDINKTGDILYKQVPTAMLPNDFVENHKLKDGDLVMITTADCGLTGVFLDQGFPFIPSAYAVRITLNKKAVPLYFKYIFQTDLAKNQVEKFIRKGTVANLPGSDILKFIFPVPNVEEQKKIAEILSSVDEKLSILNEKKTHYQELKQGLMQQLLTGKIRVKID